MTDLGSWRTLPPGTISLETYSAMQLDQPFAKRRTMQAIINDFREPAGHDRYRFGKALVGIRESQAHKEGPLTRRTATRNGPASTGGGQPPGRLR